MLRSGSSDLRKRKGIVFGGLNMTGQSIFLPGVSNARELGGYKAGGKRIKNGVLIRSSVLGKASPEALDTLQKQYRVQAVIDLRSGMESSSLPDPAIEGAKNIHLPPFEMEDMLTGIDPALVEQFSDPKMDRMAFFQAAYEGGILSDRLYEQFLLTDYSKRAWKAFFQVLLMLEDDRAVLWHCTDGKDRTGCAAMLILFALGADWDTVMQDYLLTNEYNADKLYAVWKKTAALNWPRDKVNGLLFMSGGVFAGYMANAIGALIEGYGSVEAYLGQELGVGITEIEELRRKFLISLDMDS